MRSWAQRTARWTVRTLPFSFGRADGEVHAGTGGGGTCPSPAPRQDDHGSRYRAAHQRAAAAPVRGKHAAPRPQRRARVF
jgi:hypothetical protein